jgi:hypothetical protein
MEPWVIPFLRELRPEFISNEVFESEIKHAPYAWRRMANLFLHRFESDAMTELLGSVLCDLSREAFDKILRSYPFFILSRGPGFCQELHAKGDVALVIFCESDLAPMRWTERRGVLVHELSHIFLDHLVTPFSLDDPFGRRREEETDDTCREWGFSEEIQAIRYYLNQKKRRELNYENRSGEVGGTFRGDSEAGGVQRFDRPEMERGEQ